MKVITQADRSFLPSLKKAALRGRTTGAAVEKTVRTILQAVERGGDKAVLRYTKQFDKIALKPEAVRVTAEEIKNAYFHIRKDEGDALRLAAQRITSFHERQRTKTWMYQDGDVTLGQVVGPVDAVGVYVPGESRLPLIRADVCDSCQGGGCFTNRDGHATAEGWNQPLSTRCG